MNTLEPCSTATVGAAKRKPVAMDVLNTAQHLAERSQKVAEHLNSKLTPVMRQPTPEPESNNKTVGNREYPPLFGEMRDSFLLIEKALNQIDYALERTEL